MHRCRAFSLLFLISLFAALAAEGQIASSPFSAYGIGSLQSEGVVQNKGMGSIGIGTPSNWYINTLNPALLTFNHVTSFQAGMQFEKRVLNSGGNTQSFQNANIDYLMVAFPLKANKWTTSIGLTPYSSVNYNLSYQQPAEGSSLLIDYQQSGKGGLNQFYWSNGVRINKYVSAGVKASYLFGSIVTSAASYNAAALANGGVYVRDSFNGLSLTGGLALHFDSLFSKKDYRLNIGAVGTLRSDLNAQHVKRLQSVGVRGTIIDSLTIDNQGGKLILPWTAGFGFSFGKRDRWTAGFDFTYLDFRKFDYRTNDFSAKYTGTPTEGYRAGFGFEITPRPEDFTSYFNRVTYRVGANYETSYMRQPENGHSFADIGGTFGLSLPVNQISTIDVGIKVGKRGTASQNLLEENYFRVYFGVTFNDRFWFIKRKFD